MSEFNYLKHFNKFSQLSFEFVNHQNTRILYKKIKKKEKKSTNLVKIIKIQPGKFKDFI